MREGPVGLTGPSRCGRALQAPIGVDGIHGAVDLREDAGMIALGVEQMGQDLDGLAVVAGAVEPRGVVQRVGEHGYAASSKSGRPGILSRSSSAYSLRWSASMSETTSSARIECSCEPLSSPSRS